VGDQLTTAADALDWFGAERSALLAAVQLAAGAGLGTRAWQLVWSLSNFLLRDGLWHEQARMCKAGLEAASRAGDITGQAHCLHRLAVGYTHAQLGNYPQALAFCEQALAVVRELGAANWENAVLDSLGYIHHQLGDQQQAITCYQRSLDLSRELADRWTEATALDHLGDTYHDLGDTAAAHRAWTHALRVFSEIDHPDGDPLRAKLHSHRASQAPTI